MDIIDPRQYRDYTFRGEGRANYVISAKCIATSNRIVWRIGKDGKTGKFSTHPKNERIMQHLEKLILPLLGRDYVIMPRMVHFTSDDLDALSSALLLPPAVKVHDFDFLKHVDQIFSRRALIPSPSTGTIDVLEMPDLTRIDKLGRGLYGPRITVEIKPKQGFVLPLYKSTTSLCANCIFQLEKWHSGVFNEMYDFCPLDLYSGNLDRMRKAIRALIRAPHRNLRVFLDAVPVLGQGGQPEMNAEKFKQLMFADQTTTDKSMDNFVDSLNYILAGVASPLAQPFTGLQSNSVLNQILKVQQLDNIGVLRAHELYSLLCESERRSLDSFVPQDLSFLHKSDPMSQLLRYFVAATVKDCSIMITLRAIDVNNGMDQYVGDVVRLPGTDTAFVYHVNVIDLDPKSAKNLISSHQRFLDGLKLAKTCRNKSCF